jgi:hypothetical protein
MLAPAIRCLRGLRASLDSGDDLRTATASASDESGAYCDECGKDNQDGACCEKSDKGGESGESGARCEEGSQDGESREGRVMTA